MTRHATIIFQSVVVILAAANQMAEIFPPVVQKYVPFLLLCVTGIQAVIAHGYTPEGDKIRKIRGDGEEIIKSEDSR